MPRNPAKLPSPPQKKNFTAKFVKLKKKSVIHVAVLFLVPSLTDDSAASRAPQNEFDENSEKYDD